MSAITRVVIACTAAVALAPALAAQAAANGPDDAQEAGALVLQAVALIVHTPHEEHAIEERVHDALETQHTEDVDLALVEQAHAAFHDGHLEVTRELLQTSIGAGPFVGSGVPLPIREAQGAPGLPAFAVGAETGTTVVLDEYHPPTTLSGGELVLLAFSSAGIALGALFAWRFRPSDSVRQLRRAAGF